VKDEFTIRKSLNPNTTSQLLQSFLRIKTIEIIHIQIIHDFLIELLHETKQKVELLELQKKTSETKLLDLCLFFIDHQKTLLTKAQVA
jgi:hypothetical protein